MSSSLDKLSRVMEQGPFLDDDKGFTSLLISIPLFRFALGEVEIRPTSLRFERLVSMKYSDFNP